MQDLIKNTKMHKYPTSNSINKIFIMPISGLEIVSFWINIMTLGIIFLKVKCTVVILEIDPKNIFEIK